MIFIHALEDLDQTVEHGWLTFVRSQHSHCFEENVGPPTHLNVFMSRNLAIRVEVAKELPLPQIGLFAMLCKVNVLH